MLTNYKMPIYSNFNCDQNQYIKIHIEYLILRYQKNLNTLKVLGSISNKDTANFSVRTNNNDNCIKDFTSDLPEKLIIKELL